MSKLRKILISSFFVALIAPLSAQAAPIGYNFSQGGFEEGADVTGMFFGEDLNGNGQLSSANGEITDFMMSFSGNSLVQAFSLGFDALFGLVYDLDGGPLGDGISLDIEGIGADDGLFTYLAGPGPGAICGVGDICAAVFSDDGASFSRELVMVSRKVPEPGMLALFALGLAGIGLMRRRRQS